MNTETKQTLGKTADVLIAEPIGFTIKHRPVNKLHAWLISKKLLPSKTHFEIQPLVLGNMIRISRILLSIDEYDVRLSEISGLKMVNDHADKLIEVLAIAIVNTKKKPSQKLIQTIKNNLTAKELFRLIVAVHQQLDLTSFISSIILIRGLNVLKSEEPKEVSPSSQGS